MYRTVLGALQISLIGVYCYQQQPNTDQDSVLVPALWNIPNYVKDWAELPHPVQPPSGMIDGNIGIGVGDPQLVNNNNNDGETPEKFIDKRQDTPQVKAVNSDPLPPYFDTDAATVAAMQYELQSLVQTKYQAEAAIKMESGEIARTQHEAQEAERALEEATNNVRMISAHLKAAQEEASKAATRALTAQLQMSVHDQLLVSARQKLNSVTAHMIALQADLASAQQRFMLNNSTKDLETHARALRLRPQDFSTQNSASLYNYALSPNQQHNIPPEYWQQQQHQQDINQVQQQEQQQQQQQQQQQLQQSSQTNSNNWQMFNNAPAGDLQKLQSPPLFLSSKKM
ncbi:hypothetical protein O3M35_010140 [Rhynocoris fuscipes]|uniref:Uncharacterized protein n=1 Tax=Rhynocoris fuscipes TaxID=488301 RepID=A0AAW1D0N6_9HEMI